MSSLIYQQPFSLSHLTYPCACVKKPFKKTTSSYSLSAFSSLCVYTHTTPLCRPGPLIKLSPYQGSWYSSALPPASQGNTLAFLFPFCVNIPSVRKTLSTYILRTIVYRHQIAWGLNLDEPSVFDWRCCQPCVFYIFKYVFQHSFISYLQIYDAVATLSLAIRKRCNHSH